jgi:hypothetical protein
MFPISFKCKTQERKHGLFFACLDEPLQRVSVEEFFE